MIAEYEEGRKNIQEDAIKYISKQKSKFGSKISISPNEIKNAETNWQKYTTIEWLENELEVNGVAGDDCETYGSRLGIGFSMRFETINKEQKVVLYNFILEKNGQLAEQHRSGKQVHYLPETVILDPLEAVMIFTNIWINTSSSRLFDYSIQYKPIITNIEKYESNLMRKTMFFRLKNSREDYHPSMLLKWEIIVNMVEYFQHKVDFIQIHSPKNWKNKDTMEILTQSSFQNALHVLAWLSWDEPKLVKSIFEDRMNEIRNHITTDKEFLNMYNTINLAYSDTIDFIFVLCLASRLQFGIFKELIRPYYDRWEEFSKVFYKKFPYPSDRWFDITDELFYKTTNND